MDKQQALAELAALKERADALEKIINAPEVAPSLLTKPEPGGGKRYYTICGRAKRITEAEQYHTNDPNPEVYKHGNIFTDLEIAEAYAEAVDTMLLLRHQPGTVAAKEGKEQFVIDIEGVSLRPFICPLEDLDMKAGYLSPCFITRKHAQDAVDAIGADRIVRMFKTFHHIS